MSVYALYWAGRLLGGTGLAVVCALLRSVAVEVKTEAMEDGVQGAWL